MSPAGPGKVRSSMRLTAGPGPPSFMSSASPKRRFSTDVSRALGGLPVASTSRNRLTRGSSGTVWIPGLLESHSGAGHRRPFQEVQAVNREQRNGQPVDAEGDAAGVRQLSFVVVDTPHLAEVFA